jgi:hypothetical protein
MMAHQKLTLSWVHGLNGSAPALQAQSPEIKCQYHLEKTKTRPTL